MSELGSAPNQDPFWDIKPEDILLPGEEIGAYQITMSTFFNASHQVSVANGPGNPHHHSFRLQVTAQSLKLQASDQTFIPYEELRRIMDKIVAAYDDQFINQLPPFQTLQPTTEILALVIAHQLLLLSKDLPITLVDVTVMESPTRAITIKLLPAG